MIFAFPPYFWVLVYGLIIGGIVAFICSLILLARHLSIHREEVYEVESSVRLFAFLVDLVIIMLISGLISSIFYGDPFMVLWLYLSPLQILNSILKIIMAPIYLYNDILFIITISSYYSFSLLEILSNLAPYYLSILYFFIFDTFANGKTIGKRVFRVKSISAEKRKVMYYEALLNSAGKSLFFLLDLIIGWFIFAINKEKNKAEGRYKQIRLTQQLTDILVVRVPNNLPY